MVSREVLVTGKVGEVYGGGSFSIVPAHGVPMYASKWAYSLTKRPEPGQRVEFGKATHSWLWGAIRWSSTYVRLAQDQRGAGA
jgi:hypothetical protein